MTTKVTTNNLTVPHILNILLFIYFSLGFTMKIPGATQDNKTDVGVTQDTIKKKTDHLR